MENIDWYRSTYSHLDMASKSIGYYLSTEDNKFREDHNKKDSE